MGLGLHYKHWLHFRYQAYHTRGGEGVDSGEGQHSNPYTLALSCILDMNHLDHRAR